MVRNSDPTYSPTPKNKITELTRLVNIDTLEAAKNGVIDKFVATGGEGYATKQSCQKGIEAVKKITSETEVKDLTVTE